MIISDVLEENAVSTRSGDNRECHMWHLEHQVPVFVYASEAQRDGRDLGHDPSEDPPQTLDIEHVP